LNEDGDVVDEAFRLGASAYLLKNCSASDLLGAIRGVWLHPSYLSPFMTRSETVVGPPMGCRVRRKSPLRLTLRQREVLQLLAEGRSMKEAADTLKVATRTIAFHKYSMMEQLGLKTGAELVQYAVHLGLVAGGNGQFRARRGTRREAPLGFRASFPPVNSDSR
jgi:DNA-binding NarL/FixJ family response regulator